MSVARVRRAYTGIAGRQLHYRHAGAPGQPPLLLLHQSPSSSMMYEPLMARLADRFHLLAPDTPGFGSSDPLSDEAGSFDMAGCAAAVHTLLEQLDLKPCFVFGHHTGAALAVQLEHDFPGTARAMALSGPPLLDARLRRDLPGRASPFPLQEDGAHLQGMWRRIREKDPQAPLSLAQRELLLAFVAGDAYQASYRAVARQDFGGQLQAIACPVAVFAGDEDPLYGAVTPAVELLARGHRLELPGGERSYVCERQADAVAAILEDFFGQHGSH